MGSENRPRKRTQNGPQNGPQMGLKMAPETAQNGPRMRTWALGAPMGGALGPRGPEIGARGPPEGPAGGQNGAKSGPRGLKMGLGDARWAPTWDPRGAREGLQRGARGVSGRGCAEGRPKACRKLAAERRRQRAKPCGRRCRVSVLNKSPGSDFLKNCRQRREAPCSGAASPRSDPPF